MEHLYQVFRSTPTVRSLAVSASFVETFLCVPFILRKASALTLSGLNLVGSFVYVAFYLAKVISWWQPYQIQANICAFCGSCYCYYLTEVTLFLNRLDSFNPKMNDQEKRQAKVVNASGMVFSFAVVAVGITDIVHRDFGVIIWNGYEHAMFCSAPANIAIYIIFPIAAVSGSIVWLIGMYTVYKFMKSGDTGKAGQFTVLKLMLFAFTTTMVNATFIVFNHMIPYPPINFVLDFILLITIPIDVFLSLVLSGIVYMKIRAKQLKKRSTQAGSSWRRSRTTGFTRPSFSKSTAGRKGSRKGSETAAPSTSRV